MVPFTSATMATCAQPPTQARALHQFGRVAAEDRGGDRRSQRKRVSMALRHGLPVASCASCGGAAGPPERTRALGCCQVPQNTIGAAAPCPDPACCVQSSPTEFLPIATCAAGFAPSACAPCTYASGGGVAQPNGSNIASNASRREAMARMISSPDRRRWAAAGRPLRWSWTARRSRCRSAGWPPARPPLPPARSSPS